MKKVAIGSLALLILTGCNANESKEGRIRKLETQSEQTAAALQELEKRIQALESKTIDNQE